MNVYTCVDWEGHYPVGVAAVVVAADRGHARRLLAKQVRDPSTIGDIVKVDVETAAAHVLRDGDY